MDFRDCLGADMLQATALALLALCAAGCQFTRTAVPYEQSADPQSNDWAAARDICAGEGRLPVMQYEWAVVEQRSAFRCELPGEIIHGGGAPQNR